ncbi:MAG: hypothetical protein ACSHYF_00110 [Verrucomicrobiaceae bacterium]
MKHITSIILAIFLSSFASAAPRGERIDGPIKGVLLAGVKDGNEISEGVVFLADDGVIFAADSATIGPDGKSITFKGKPFFVKEGTRIHADELGEWMRLTVKGEVKTSKGKWQMVIPKK